MDQLSEDARKLIDTAMGKDAAPAPDESWGAFVEHMTSTQARSAEIAVAQAPKSRPRWWPALAVVVVLSSLAAWWLARDRPAPVAAPAPSRVPAASEPAIEAIAPPPRADPSNRPNAVAASSAHLIPEAEAALAADEPERALALLEQHAERAPLEDADQRMALRIQVLCALGREDNARAEGRAFLDTHPKSKWAADVRRSCAGK